MTSTLHLHNDLFNAFLLDGLGGAHNVNVEGVAAWPPQLEIYGFTSTIVIVKISGGCLSLQV